MTDHEDLEAHKIHVRSAALNYAVVLLRDTDVPAVTLDNYLQQAKRMYEFLIEGSIMPTEIAIPDDLSDWNIPARPDDPKDP